MFLKHLSDKTRCFENTKLINTVIPEGVTHIRTYAFTNITPTTTPTFTLPSTLQFIDEASFKRASRSYPFSISIPESVTRIASTNDNGTFAESGLESITFEGTSQIMAFENQTFFKIIGVSLIFYKKRYIAPYIIKRGG